MMRSTFLVAAPLSALLSTIPSGPSVSAVKESCRTNHTAVVATVGRETTSSKDYVDVLETNVRVIQGPGNPGCIVVTFSAEAAAPAGENLMVRALRDGDVTCEPGSVFLSRGNDATQLATAARTMTFVCTDIAPGSHKIKMQYLSNNGGPVSLEYRTMTVQYFR